jgi:tetratricopeptide (TPR) repeat protein
MALSDFLEMFPDDEKSDEVRLRLFETYMISENWEPALQIWPMINDADKNNVTMLEQWFKLNEALENDAVCDSIADQLLELDSNNLIALEWKAVNLFKSAEDRYNREMKAYENNRTNKQYKKLLDELDKSTNEFQTALNWFETLYKNDPQPRYALYMSNIYVRFNDKEKADYYRKKAGK